MPIDTQGRDVWLNGVPVRLARTEFDLLAALAERPRMAFSRRPLIERVWSEGWAGDGHLVDVHVGHPRRKLGDDATRGKFVHTCVEWATGWAPESERQPARRIGRGATATGRRGRDATFMLRLPA